MTSVLRAVPDLVPDPLPVPAPRADAPPAAVYRDGITSARRELRAGTARRHRSTAVASTSAARAPGARRRPVAPPPGAVAPASAELRTQQAGVRAALAELRQHRGPT